MLFISFDYKIININKSDYTNDTEYYKYIYSIVSNEKIEQKDFTKYISKFLIKDK